MMKKNNTTILMVLMILCMGYLSGAQKSTGINTATPNADADLELGSTNKGFLPNRVALTSVTDAAPLSAHTNGMVVYNTATAGTAPNNVEPGYYFNNGTQWVKFGTGKEPWFGVDDNKEATQNTENIYTQGNVGIKTSTPIAALEVKGTLSSKGGEVILQKPITTGGWARGLSYAPDGSVNVTADGLGGFGMYGYGANKEKLYMTFGKAPWGSTRGIQIDTTGRVGIGILNPTEKLHVNGKVRISDLPAGASTDVAVVVDANGVLKKASSSGSSSTTGSGPWLGSDDNQPATSSSENVYIMGKVGIGTSTVPSTNLDVNGTMKLENSGYKQPMSSCNNPGEIRFNGDVFLGCARSNTAGPSGYYWMQLHQ